MASWARTILRRTEGVAAYSAFLVMRSVLLVLSFRTSKMTTGSSITLLSA
jgi:hypothetical protein